MLALLCISLLSSGQIPDAMKDQLQSGDIVFQTSTSSQSDLIAMATSSPFTHCGIVISKGGELFVLEASATVRYTPLDTWVNLGRDSKIQIMRPISKPSRPDWKQQIHNASNRFLGKHYDIKFEWSDDKIYCSELVWKIYNNALNIKISSPLALSQRKLTSPAVKQELNNRYGNAIPMQEKMVSPSDLAKSNLLSVIFTNYSKTVAHH